MIYIKRTLLLLILVLIIFQVQVKAEYPQMMNESGTGTVYLRANEKGYQIIELKSNVSDTTNLATTSGQTNIINAINDKYSQNNTDSISVSVDDLYDSHFQDSFPVVFNAITTITLPDIFNDIQIYGDTDLLISTTVNGQICFPVKQWQPMIVKDVGIIKAIIFSGGGSGTIYIHAEKK